MTKPQPVPCRSCGTPMHWVITAGGKKMPVNATPDPKGGFVLTLKANGELHAAAADPHESKRNRFTSHFATCKDAGAWRRA